MGLVNFPEMLTLELVNTYVRDSKEDILYNPDKKETRNKDYCLFYYIDKNGNKVFAYNRHLITADTLNICKYKNIYGAPCRAPSTSHRPLPLAIMRRNNGSQTCIAIIQHNNCLILVYWHSIDIRALLYNRKSINNLFYFIRCC